MGERTHICLVRWQQQAVGGGGTSISQRHPGEDTLREEQPCESRFSNCLTYVYICHIPLVLFILYLSLLIFYILLIPIIHLNILISGAKTVKKNTNSTQNKSQTHRAKQYEFTSFLSTDCELSTETCSKNVYILGPWFFN